MAAVVVAGVTMAVVTAMTMMVGKIRPPLLSMDNYTYIDAVVLVMLVEQRRVKVKIFYGQTSSDVTDFTEDAKYYTR